MSWEAKIVSDAAYISFKGRRGRRSEEGSSTSEFEMVKQVDEILEEEEVAECMVGG